MFWIPSLVYLLFFESRDFSSFLKLLWGVTKLASYFMKLSLMFEMTYIVISYRFSIARCENTINLGTTVWAVQTLGLNFLPVTEKAWHLYFHTAFISCAALIFGPKEKRKGKGLLLSSPALHGGFLIIKRNFCKLIFLQIATLPKACVPPKR